MVLIASSIGLGVVVDGVAAQAPPGGGAADDRDDTDGDGLSNDRELNIHGTDHRDPDTDGDGLDDGDEVDRGTDPLRTDTDRDGLDDGDEVDRGTDPTHADTDSDGVPDGDEVADGTDPLDTDDPNAFDDDLLGNLVCASGQVVKWDGSAWQCGDDLDTTYAGGTGIDVTGTTISATLGDAVDGSEIVDGSVAAADIDRTGLDADLLDGLDASAFALAGHDHDVRYYARAEATARFVDASGDAMTGDLDMGGNVVENAVLESDSLSSASSAPLGIVADHDMDVTAGDAMTLSGEDIALDASDDLTLDGSSIAVSSAGALSVASLAEFDLDTGQYVTIDAGTDVDLRAGTGMDLESAVDMDLTTGGSMDLTAGGVLTLDATAVTIDAAVASVSGQLIAGSLSVSGLKNFVETVETPDGTKEVVYTSVEAARVRTEVSGVGQLEDGRAVVDLPDHFGLVTNATEPLVIQLTPYGGTAGLKVVAYSTDRIVVEELGGGDGNYAFAYTVKGIREGYEDKPIVRDPADGE